MSNETKKTALPKLRFPEFDEVEEWSVPTLAEISDPVLEKVGNLILPTVSITAGTGFVLQSDKFGRDISGDQYKRYTLLRKGELAYNKGNSKRYPEGCIYQLKEFEQAATPNVFYSFRFKSDFLADFYQGYFDNNFHGNQLKKFITSGARSNGLLNISSKAFFSIELPTPRDIAEQQKVAYTLSSLNDLITAQNDKLAALKAHKRGLMQGLFPAEGEAVPKLRFPEFQDAEEWEETTLEKVATYENGKAHEQHITEIGKFAVVNSRFVSTEGAVKKQTNTAFCLAKRDDILMVLSDLPKGRALAKCFFVDEDHKYTVNQRVCRITAKSGVAKMLFYILNRNPYFLALDDGVTQTHIRKDEVLDFPLLIPKQIEEQQKIADCLSYLDNRITAQTQKIEALKLHKKGLMQNLFPAAAEPTA